ncbi:MAG: hypothetical protein ACPGSE_06915, partial [Synechococcus sp.]
MKFLKLVRKVRHNALVQISLPSMGDLAKGFNLLFFGCRSREAAMPNVDATIETRRLRRELVADGADPYWVAAEALQTIDRLRNLLAEYQAQY